MVADLALKKKGKDAKLPVEPLDLRLQFELREPKPPTEFDLFVAELDDSQRPFATILWRMACQHTDEVIENDPHGTATWVRCKRCDSLRRWLGSTAKTRQGEWMTYCPDGFDMFDWDELYTRDKTLWPFIHDEALYAMLEDAMTSTEED